MSNRENPLFDEMCEKSALNHHHHVEELFYRRLVEPGPGKSVCYDLCRGRGWGDGAYAADRELSYDPRGTDEPDAEPAFGIEGTQAFSG